MKELSADIERAIAGDERTLFDRLQRGSRLPGTRPNLDLAEQFANEAAAIGERASGLAIGMATLHPDRAQGGTQFEFLPMCGVLAVGALAAQRPSARLLVVLHDAAEDLRFRVRDMVPLALAKVGVRDPSLVEAVQDWMDGYFHAAAVLRALAIPAWLSSLDDARAPTERVREGLTLIASAPRSAERWPGFKALVDAITIAVPALALRFGEPVFEVLGERASSKDPALRELVVRALADKKLTGRFPEDVARVRDALSRAAPAPRDPRASPRPTRRRGKR